MPERAGKNIAILGSAPSSCLLAPFKDRSWTIWGCSPALAQRAEDKRINVWFELHPLDDPEFGLAYRQFVLQFDGLVMVAKPDPRLPQSEVYPKEVADEFCGIARTSSIGWMMMLAINLKPEKIGIWGVDMSHNTEWGKQRYGMQYLIWEARKRGIKVFIPPESDLDILPFEYGFCFHEPEFRKLWARKKELDTRAAHKAAERDKANGEFVFISGAKDNLDYIIETYPYDTRGSDRTALQATTGQAEADRGVHSECDGTKKVRAKPRKTARGLGQQGGRTVLRRGGSGRKVGAAVRSGDRPSAAVNHIPQGIPADQGTG